MIPKKRIDFIDALRGYAILMMLQGHTVGVVLEEKWKGSGHWIYETWNYMRGITAPAFLFAAGLILAYLFFSSSPEKCSLRVGKTWKRGFLLMVIGALTLVQSSTWVNVFSGNWSAISFYKHTSVLHVIGAALVMTAAVMYLCRRRPLAAIWAFAGLAAVCFLGAPWICNWQSGIGVIDFFITPRKGSLFTLTPWLGHYFLGCLFGFWAAKRQWYLNVWLLLGMIVLGFWSSRHLYIVHRMLDETGLLDGDKQRFIQLSYDQLYRFGDVLVLTGVVALLARAKLIPQWLRTCGKETLSIYVIHDIVVYAAIFGVGYVKIWRRALDPWQTAGLAVITLCVFILLAQQLPRLREKLPWLKWIH